MTEFIIGVLMLNYVFGWWLLGAVIEHRSNNPTNFLKY